MIEVLPFPPKKPCRQTQHMKTPQGYNQRLLYLDFDGVLHHENCLWHPNIGPYLSAPSEFKLFMHVDLLEKLLAPYPQILIVLSTSWSVRYGVAKAAKNLSPSLRSRVIGGTHHSRMNKPEFLEKPRGVQVLEDTMRRKPRTWVAIDDDDESWPSHCRGNLVLTHKHDGITAPAVLAELRTKLAEMSE